MRLLKIFICIIHGALSSRPEVFWKFNDQHLLSQKQDVNGKNYPSYLPNSYDQRDFTKNLTPYSRDTPSSWMGSTPGKIEDSKVLPLGRRTKISQGPRRRKRRSPKEGSWETPTKSSVGPKVPLFCYKYKEDCDAYPEHICCTLSPDNKNKSSRKESLGQSNKKKASIDPLFKIPINVPDEEIVYKVPDKWNRIQLTPIPKPLGDRRCECGPDSKDACCIDDRLLAFEPYVQSSLLENWVSRLFELFGQNPAFFVLAKNIVLVSAFLVLAVIWGILGTKLGFFPEWHTFASPAQIRSRAGENAVDLDTAANNLFLFINKTDDWVRQLEHQLKNNSDWSGVGRLVCCLLPEGKLTNSGLRCTPKDRKRPDTVVQCMSNLTYSVRINKNKD